jgi:hypothetical protein
MVSRDRESWRLLLVLDDDILDGQPDQGENSIDSVAVAVCLFGDSTFIAASVDVVPLLSWCTTS